MVHPLSENKKYYLINAYLQCNIYFILFFFAFCFFVQSSARILKNHKYLFITQINFFS